MSRRKILAVWAVVIALTVILALILAACGRHCGQVTQLSLAPPTIEQPAEEQDSDDGGVLPPVLELDGCIAVSREVSEDDTRTSQGWEAYRDGQTGTNGTSGLNVETEGTALTLRAYTAGEYAYAVYGQAVGAVLKPLQTLIDSDPCAFGGGQDDDIPLSYFVGAADYSRGSWRWFGPFGEEDVMVTMNSEMLRSRFKSPNGNFYLCVLASNGSKAASALPEEGLVANFPLAPSTRRISAQDNDPGGLKVKEIVTWVRENLYMEPAVVTGLSVSTSTAGVTLDWDKNPDPDVDIYQIFRRDADTEDPGEMIASVFATRTYLADSKEDPLWQIYPWEVGVPGKEYEYSVRARNDAGYGGYSIVTGIRLMTAPTVDASDGAYSDHVRIDWTAVEGAEGYSVLRADTIDGAKIELASTDSETFTYNDYDVVLEKGYYYWIQSSGEDIVGPLGGPDAGLALELEPLQVIATDGDYPDRVELIWGESDAPLLEYYSVYRDTDEVEGGEEFLGSVTPPEHACTDYTAPWDEPRFYFVRPFTGSEGDPGTGNWGHRGLAVPGNVTATQGTFAGKVVVSWDAVNQATRYRVYRGASAGDPSPQYLGEVPAPAMSYQNPTAQWDVHYFYSVLALHTGPDDEASDLSEPAEGWRGTGIPENVSATDGTKKASVNVSWNAVSQATHYRVYRSETENDPTPTLLNTVSAPATGYTDNAAAHNTLYWYCVSALYKGDEGAKSADDSGYRGLSPPLNVQASDDLEDTIEITWSSVTGATGYIICRSETDTGTYTEIGTDDASPYLDGPFTPPVIYWYKLKATNSLATSAFSNADEGSVGGDLRGDWWMFGREPTHNRRSPYVGAQTNSLKWRHPIGDFVKSSPAIGADGTVYVGNDCDLSAIRPDGTLKWEYQTEDQVDSSPAVGEDGTVYVRSWDGYLYAIKPDGSLDWRCQTGEATGNWVDSSPTIGEDGTIYVGSFDGDLCAIKPDGTLKWRYETGNGVYSGPAIGSDGTIYVGSDDYYIYAIKPDGTLKWRFETDSYVDASSAIGADGTVYVGSFDGNLYALRPDGTLKWSYETGGGVYSSTAIGEDGTIYVGSDDDYLYAIRPDGSLKWRYQTDDSVLSSPAVGADGTIYVGSWGGFLYAVNPNGTLKWMADTGGEIWSSPAIGADGTVYVGCDDGYLFAFNAVVEQPPTICSVSPIVGQEVEPVTFSAEVWGTQPFAYSWDFGGGATPNTSSETSPTVTLGVPGSYDASLDVTNTYGEDTFGFTLTVNEPGDYDEVEDNDSPSKANQLPSFDFSSFTGSLGPGGYDGDDHDWFEFTASVDDTVKLWMHLDSGTGDLDIELEDSDGIYLDGSGGIGNEEYIEYTFQVGDTSPFYLHVYAYSGYSDYIIVGHLF